MVEVNKEKTISLDVDPQNGFTFLCPGELPVEDGENIGEELNLNATKAKFRMFSKDAHGEHAEWLAKPGAPQLSPVNPNKELIDMDMRWNRHCIVSTPGFAFIPGLPHPRKYDFFVYKGAEPDMHPYSAIYHNMGKTISTGIIEWATAKRCNTFIVGGLALNLNQTPMCVGETLFDLVYAGFEVILNLASTRSIRQFYSKPDIDYENENKKFVQRLRDAGVIVVNNASEIDSN